MPSFSNQLLSQLSEHLAAQMGWHFPPEKWRDLQSGIEAAARELGIADATAYARDLLGARLTRPQIEVLASALTVGETYFFRDSRSFEILAEQILPRLIAVRRRSSRRLRIWSAGCCTGEEAYSMAILLDRLLPDLSEWQITLLATDINSRFLHKAAAGCYSEWSFRAAPPWLKERYFKASAAGRFELLPHIKSLVTFDYLNLGEDVYPSLNNNTNAMDLILCRNVLMYFSAARTAQVLGNLHRALVADGLFMTSAVEVSPQLNTYFVAEPFDGAVAYRKRTQPSPAMTPVAEEPPVAFLPLEPATPLAAGPVQTPGHEPIVGDMQDVYAAAQAMYKRGEYTQAAAVLKDREPDFTLRVDCATLLARIYANLGDLNEAYSWAERAIAAERTNAVSYYLSAVILLEQKRMQDAAMSLQKAIYLDPQFVLAHFALGNIEQRQGRVSAAARHFNNALELLRRLDDEDVLPHSDGMAAGRLREMMRSISAANAA